MQTTTRIRAEQPYRKLWDLFVYFENEQTTSEFLRNRYEAQAFEKVQTHVYHATPKFIFSVKQAREYYKAAEACDILTKPLLLYYGMMALSKALITSFDPEYPSSTSVLKHGLSTRKLKRDNYQFADDEVRVQKDGIFNVLHRVLKGPSLENKQRFRMKELLAVIPELLPAFDRLYGPKEAQICPLEILQQEQQTLWQIPRSFVANCAKTKEELLEILNRHGGETMRFSFSEGMKDAGYFRMVVEGDSAGEDRSIGASVASSSSDVTGVANFAVTNHPLILYDFSGQPHLRFPHEGDLVIPEISLHYMVMFVLGMLCRYETEQWGEMILTFSSHDAFLINEFLNVSMRKFPNLILDELWQARNLFYTP